MLTWLDHPIDLFAAQRQPEQALGMALAHLFVTAARQGWDVAHATLYALRRTVRWETTVRLVLVPPPDVLAKWQQRGWLVVCIDDAMRAQLLQLLPAQVSS